MTKFCVKKPFTVLVAVIMVLVLGFVSLSGMQTDLLPDFSLPYLVVITTYPGASPEKVESAVTEPMENALGTISGVENVTSTSAENYSMVMLEFVDDMDMDSAMVKVSSALDDVEASLPDLCSTPSVMEVSMDMMATMYVAVSYDDKDIYDVSDFTEDTVVPYLERQSGVASISDIGLVEKTIQISLNQDKIDAMNDKLLRQVSDRMDEAGKELEDAKAELEDAQAEIDSNTGTAASGIGAANQALSQLSAYQTQLTNQQADLAALQTARQAAVDAMEEQGMEVDKLGDTISTMKLTGNAMSLIYTTLSNQNVSDDTDISGLQELFDRFQFTTSISELTGEGIQTVGDIKTTADTMLSAADQMEEAKTTIDQFDTEITNLQVEIQVTQTIVSQYQSAIGSYSYSTVAQGEIAAAAGIGSADAQMAAAQSQLDSAQEEYENAREEALKSANLDSLLNIDTLSQLIYAQNFAMPAGYINAGEDGQYLLKVGDEFESVDDITDMLLCTVDGIGDVRISDVADVTVIDNTEDSYARMNGDEAVVLSIYKGSTAGTSAVSKACSTAIEELEEEYPGLHVTVLMDQGDYIELIVNALVSDLLEGAVFAIIVLLLFLQAFGPTIAVALSIPFSVLFALVLMYFSNITLNMISLSGLALGVGMLVDNSVVVIENIYRLRARGLPTGRAAVQGTKQVSGAIIASTVTTICVFLPLLFASGLVKDLMGDMGLTIAYALLASLVVAMTVVPTMSVFLLRKTRQPKHRLYNKMLKGYETALRFCLRFKVVPLVLAVALLVFSGIAVTQMGIVLMPETGSNQVSVTVTMPEELDRDACYAVADQVMEACMTVDGIQDVGGMTTSTMSQFVYSDAGTSDYYNYTFYIMLKDDAQVKQVCADIAETTAGLNCTVDAEATASMDMTSYLSSGLSVDLYGQDLDDLLQASEDVMDIVKGIDGFTDVSNGQEEGDAVVQLKIDKDFAMSKGLTVAQIYQELTSALTTEQTSTTVTVDGTDMSVQVENNSDPLEMYNLLDYEFETTTTDEDGNTVNETVKLGEIADLEYGTGVASISRENQTRTMSVTATTEDGYNTTLLSRQVSRELEDYEAPEGVTIQLGGETDTVNDMLVQMGKMIALALLFIYLVMVAQFQSLLSPFIVIFTIPLAFTGGLLGLLIAGQNLSMISLMGFLVLSGVVVNNGIVFVDYVNQLRLNGLDRKTALVATGCTRMRPILMTTLTTVLAMVMMIFAQDAGSQMSKGMAIVVVGGLSYATLMTLFIVPVMYDLLYRREVLVVDVGDEELDDAPDDAAEFAEIYHAEDGTAAEEAAGEEDLYETEEDPDEEDDYYDE